MQQGHMGGGDPYTPCIGHTVRSGQAVHSRCKCKKVIWVVGTVTFQCKKVKPPLRTVDAVHAVNGSYKYMGSLQFLFIWYLDFIVVASSR